MLNKEQIQKAKTWYDKHTYHINNIIKDIEHSYLPSDPEDMNNPLLWKSEHWKAFIEKYM